MRLTSADVRELTRRHQRRWGKLLSEGFDPTGMFADDVPRSAFWHSRRLHRGECEGYLLESLIARDMAELARERSNT